MEDYDKEIFKFFTNEENFKKMLKVAAHKSVVMKTLQTEFWNGVVGQIKERNKKAGTKWSVRIAGDIFHRHTKLLVYKETWDQSDVLPPVAIAFERLATPH